MNICPKCKTEMIRSGSDLEIMYKGGPYGVVVYICPKCKYVEFYGDMNEE